jgi:RNA polymerase sigma-70 factor, ECF subfamily
VSALVTVLDPDVWGEADLGPHVRRGGRRRGATKVSHNLLRWFRPTTALVCNPIGDHSEILAFEDRKLYAVLQLTIEDDLVKRIHVIVDPARLAVIAAQLAAH